MLKRIFLIAISSLVIFQCEACSIGCYSCSTSIKDYAYLANSAFTEKCFKIDSEKTVFCKTCFVGLYIGKDIVSGQLYKKNVIADKTLVIRGCLESNNKNDIQIIREAKGTVKYTCTSAKDSNAIFCSLGCLHERCNSMPVHLPSVNNRIKLCVFCNRDTIKGACEKGKLNVNVYCHGNCYVRILFTENKEIIESRGCSQISQSSNLPSKPIHESIRSREYRSSFGKNIFLYGYCKSQVDIICNKNFDINIVHNFRSSSEKEQDTISTIKINRCIYCEHEDAHFNNEYKSVCNLDTKLNEPTTNAINCESECFVLFERKDGKDYISKGCSKPYQLSEIFTVNNLNTWESDIIEIKNTPASDNCIQKSGGDVIRCAYFCESEDAICNLNMQLAFSNNANATKQTKEIRALKPDLTMNQIQEFVPKNNYVNIDIENIITRIARTEVGRFMGRTFINTVGPAAAVSILLPFCMKVAYTKYKRASPSTVQGYSSYVGSVSAV